MNLSIQDELQLFSEELYRHLTLLFGRTRKELGFVKKKRKFSGNELNTCIWVSQRTARTRLFDYAVNYMYTGTLMSQKDSINALIKSG